MNRRGGAIIRYRGVSKVFGKRLVLDSLDLEIKKGEIFGIVGISGAGKTTMLNMLVGFVEPEEGKIDYQPFNLLNPHKGSWVSIHDRINDVKKNFGFASQIPSFYKNLTVFENLFYFASLYDLQHDTKLSNIEVVLDLVGLNDSQNEYAENLSGGMKKRLDIACALVHDPQVLILDEPTADLDPVLRRQMWELIKKINRRGTTILMSSHFLDEIEMICHRVGILHRGKIKCVGTAQQLKNKFAKNEQIIIETSPGNYRALIRMMSKMKKEISKLENKKQMLIIHTPRSENVLHKILSIIKKRKESLINITVKKPSLEQIFDILDK